jgi:hypothetical protein
VLFVRSLDAIFALIIAWHYFDHLKDAAGRIPTDTSLENHSISDIEFVRWHRFPLFGQTTGLQPTVIQLRATLIRGGAWRRMMT